MFYTYPLFRSMCLEAHTEPKANKCLKWNERTNERTEDLRIARKMHDSHWIDTHFDDDSLCGILSDFTPLTLWFESFVMTGVLLSTIPLRISANSCERPLSVPLPLPLCMSCGGGGGGGGNGAAIVVDDSFAIVAILRHQSKNRTFLTSSQINPAFH